jgi:AmmeMemoRadiSam system protein A/AmmeMemoRadiSam system protein B
MEDGKIAVLYPLLTCICWFQKGSVTMAILAAFVVPHPPIILPEIGRGEEKKIARTTEAYRQVMKAAAELKPDTLVITSPHADAYLDYHPISPGREAYGDFGQFRAPQVKIHVTYDEELAKTIAKACKEKEIPAGLEATRHDELDHGTMIPLYFFRQFMPLDQVKVVRIGLSGQSAGEHYRLGKTIAECADKLNRRVVFIASGDLSHKLKEDGPYGFAPEGPVFDRDCMDAIARGDFLALLTMDHSLCERAAECGLRSFWIMTGALDRKAVSTKVLSHEDVFGVGYGVAAITIKGDDPENNWYEQLHDVMFHRREIRKNNEDPYVKLARRSVETYVRTGSPASLPDNLPPEMLTARHGAFVSLHLYGQLRGCIGTISPVRKNVAQEILYNGISACSQDPRFYPVRPDELPDLEYSVDVLEDPEPIAGPEALDVKKYGVIVQAASDSRRGLLLPDLDGVDTVAKQISIARQKGNIGPKEPIKLWRFTVTRHH